MQGTWSPNNISPKLERIAKLARVNPERVLTTLAHHIDIDLLREAYRRTRKSGAPGVDGQTAVEFAKGLDENLQSLLDRFKSGTYRAPPVRRAHIPKGDGRKRPIGIPTFEDKVLQRAVTLILEAVYEHNFYDDSYGCRPGRSAHQALEVLWKRLMDMQGGWVVEVDIQAFFDHLDHGQLRAFLDQRVRDGVIRRALDKWLRAGVLEEGAWYRPDSGTPQGGVISPLLANIYLHEVLDRWFMEVVRPRLAGRAFFIRYVDDLVLVFARKSDARRVMEVLPKRLGRFGLSLHPEKTRMVEFRPPSDRPRGPRSFDFLGFTHHWGLSRKGKWVVKQRTARDRMSRAVRAVNEWCKRHRHQPLAVQQRVLSQKLRGHYGYYGIPGNHRRLGTYYYIVTGIWKEWLARRSNRGQSWERFKALLKHFPLPTPKVRRPVIV